MKERTTLVVPYNPVKFKSIRKSGQYICQEDTKEYKNRNAAVRRRDKLNASCANYEGVSKWILVASHGWVEEEDQP